MQSFPSSSHVYIILPPERLISATRRPKRGLFKLIDIECMSNSIPSFRVVLERKADVEGGGDFCTFTEEASFIPDEILDNSKLFESGRLVVILVMIE